MRRTVCMFPLGCEHKPVGEPHVHTTLPDSSAPIIKQVLAEVALIQSHGKGKVLSEMTEIERRTFNIANSITQLLRLSKEGK